MLTFSSRFGNAFCYQQHVRFYGHLGCNVILKNNRHTASVQGSVRPAAARVGAGERSCAEGRERGRVDTNVLSLQLATINYFTFKKCNNLKWIGFHKQPKLFNPVFNKDLSLQDAPVSKLNNWTGLGVTGSPHAGRDQCLSR